MDEKLYWQPNRGLAVVHQDGDAGVISGFMEGRWIIGFCSGYQGNFSQESASDPSVFAWFPPGHSPTPDADVRDRLSLLSRLAEMVDAQKSHEAQETWRKAACSEWFPLPALEALVATREAPRLARERAANRAEIDCMLHGLKVEEARQLYESSRAYEWWPKEEFAQRAARAEALRDLSASIGTASLSDVDDLMQDMVAAQLADARELALLKLEKLRIRMARMAIALDDEQLEACSLIHRHRLIQARAGSGKTRTLAAHAALCIHDQELQADQVLILAFNKKAATEIGDRVRNAAGIGEFRNARTFHSLAWNFADHADRELIFDDGELSPSRRKQSGFMERLIKGFMNPAVREDVYEFFRKEIEQLDDLGSTLTNEEYAAFRRTISDYTLSGDNVKSKGEKYIADFLFEHDIPFRYEKVWSWQKGDQIGGTPYRPDFSITAEGRDIVLEHWAFDPDNPAATVPSWWDTGASEYRHQIEEKRTFWTERGITLLETHCDMLVHGRAAFEEGLRNLLAANGVRCVKLPREELVRRVVEAPRAVSRLADLFLQFISRAKKRGWSVNDVAERIRVASEVDRRTRAFQVLGLHAYTAYQRELETQRTMDFDDLMVSAADHVRRHGAAARLRVGKTDSLAVGDLRWILIDEFQDFSELYYQLILAMQDANPQLRVVGVGDDWQAINGFAGAQLTYFSNFELYFPGAGRAGLSSNRRSGKLIVGAGNEVMGGCGEAARAGREHAGQIDIVAVDRVWIEAESIYLDAATSTTQGGRRTTSWELAKALKACADLIALSVYRDQAQGHLWMPNVLVLARTSRAYGRSLRDFAERLERVLSRHPDLQSLANHYNVTAGSPSARPAPTVIEVMTAHKSKGKEADTVIVLECVSDNFPKMHADNKLFGLFGVTVADVLAEERRLFYVAATRAEYRLAFLTESGRESPYLRAVRAAWPATAPLSEPSPQLNEDLQSLHARLNLDSFIRQNISLEAQAAWMRAGDLPSPSVGYSLQEGLVAELAWPTHSPKTAILTGAQKAKSIEWRRAGWRVY